MRFHKKILIFMVAFGVFSSAKISWNQESQDRLKSWVGLPPDQLAPQTKTSLFENKLFLDQIYRLKTPEEWQDILYSYDFNQPIELVDNYLVILAKAKPVENQDIQPYRSEQQRDLTIIFDEQQGRIITLCQAYYESSWRTPGPEPEDGRDNSFVEGVTITYYRPAQPSLVTVLQGSVGDCGGNAENAVKRWNEVLE